MTDRRTRPVANVAARRRPPLDRVDAAIVLLRGHKVLLDSALAILYDVPVKVLNQAVQRNIERFPADFMFQLSVEEVGSLRSQSVTLKVGRGTHRKYRPYAFTEQGVAMLSSVLKSPRAIAVNIEIMRAFVRLRAMTATVDQLRDRLDELERKYDGQFRAVFDAIRRLMEPPPLVPKRIGFTAATSRREPRARRRT